MGYVVPHIYILTGDERFKEDFDKQQRRDVIGIAIGGGIYAILVVGG